MGDDPKAASPRSERTASDPASTIELIDRARQGDQEALERLFARHHLPLRRWTSGRLPRWAREVVDTDDLVQDALLQTFRHIGDFEARGAGALHAYLREAVLNKIRDELRKRGRHGAAAGLDGREADHGQSPLELAIGRETFECYERALSRLKPEEREAIIGRVEMGYSYEELAAALGKVSSEAARKTARRALLRLVNEMERPAP